MALVFHSTQIQLNLTLRTLTRLSFLSRIQAQRYSIQALESVFSRKAPGPVNILFDADKLAVIAKHCVVRAVAVRE